MSVPNAALALVAGTAVGVMLTLIFGSEPGFLLAFFIIVGSIVAALGTRPNAAYLFFPMPALAFFVAAVISGAVHDRSLESSTAGLAAAAAQWVGGIFVPACVATVVVLVIGSTRWVLARQFAIGQFTASGRPGAPRSARPASARRRPAASNPRTGQDRSGQPRAGRDPWRDPRQGGPAQQRAPRQQPRDPWEPRPPRPSRDQRSPRDSWDQ